MILKALLKSSLYVFFVILVLLRMNFILDLLPCVDILICFGCLFNVETFALVSFETGDSQIKIDNCVHHNSTFLPCKLNALKCFLFECIEL